MNIGIDLDGVLRDFSLGLHRQYKRIYPDHKRFNVENWDLRISYPDCDDIFKFAFRTYVDEVNLDAPMYQLADVFVARLKLRDHETTLITHGYRVVEWLKKNDMHDMFDNIIILNPTATLKKSDIPVDVMLDDNINNLKNFDKHNRTTAVCMDRPWNKEYNGLRVYSLDHFLQLIDSMKG